MEKNDLPESWLITPLENLIIQISNGATEKQSKEKTKFPVSRIETISNETIDFNRVRYLKNPSSSIIKKYKLEKGDILFSNINSDSHLGKTAIFYDEQTLIHGMNLLLIRSNLKIINPKFLNFTFNYFRKLGLFYSIAQHAVNQSSINQTKIKQIQISLPPLNEQKRIVAKIDELFSRLDVNIVLLQKITLNLNSYVHSFLKDTFEGKLTALWREQNNTSSVLDAIQTKLNKSKNKKKINFVDETYLPSLPDKWAWVNFEMISSNDANAIKAGPFGSSLKKEFYVSSGYKIYGQEQVIRNDPEYGDYYIDAKRFEMLRSCEVKPEDLLISLVGTIGKTLVLPTKIKAGIINPRLIKITLDKDLSYSKYIQIYFESQNAKNYFKLSSHGGTMAILNMNILKKLPIPLPPLKEQYEIITKYELELSLVEDVKLQVQQIMEKILMLKNVILKQAFEGKLIPQDPNDEPASELLKRIKSNI